MNPKDLMYTQRRFSFLHLISFVVFVAVLVYGGYTFITKAGLESSIVAGQLIEKIEADEVKWSEMLSTLLGATPLDIYYASYSGSESGSVTVSGLGDSYGSISGLISALSGQKAFKDVFVTSVASASSGDTEMVSFNMSFVYDDNKVAVTN